MDLSQFTTAGKYLMLALDHRGSLKKLMNPNTPDSVTDDAVVALKTEIIKALENQFSGLLIDETFGLKAYPQKTKPFLLPLEKTGYTDQAGERVNELGCSVQHLIDMGARGAKLLIYFNPDVKSSETQIQTALQVFHECKDLGFPIFIEIVTYLPGEGDMVKERPRLVIKSIEKFLQNGVIPDVFKLEYPGSFESCQEITKLLRETPWILLTRGDNFETFKTELEEAHKAGCQGFLAGRALWQEVCALSGEEKNQFLQTTLPERFRIIAEIALK